MTDRNDETGENNKDERPLEPPAFPTPQPHPPMDWQPSPPPSWPATTGPGIRFGPLALDEILFSSFKLMQANWKQMALPR